MDSTDAEWVRRRCVDQPIATFGQPIEPTGRWQSIPRKGYILAERLANSRFGVFAERVRNTPGWQYSGIAAGHDVMVDKPQQLADILVDLGHA
jgi:hypothetical protein